MMIVAAAAAAAPVDCSSRREPLRLQLLYVSTHPALASSAAGASLIAAATSSYRCNAGIYLFLVIIIIL